MMEDHKKDSAERLAKMRSEIWESLEILREAMRISNEACREQLRVHGDLYYRPDGENQTELVMTPLAAKARLELKSLLECVAIIDGKLGGKPEKPDEESEGEFDAKDFLRSRGRKES